MKVSIPLSNYTLMGLLFLLVSNCTLNTKAANEALENQIIEKNNQLSATNHVLENLTNKFFLEKKMDLLPFTNNAFLKDSNKTDMTWPLSQEKGPHLIFKYSFLNCNECVEKQFQLLKELSSEIGPDKIKIFGHFQSLRDFVVFEKNNELGFDIYMINSSAKAHPILSDSDNPYFFILNGNKAEYTFIPIIEKPELTSSYLSFAKRYLYEENI